MDDLPDPHADTNRAVAERVCDQSNREHQAYSRYQADSMTSLLALLLSEAKETNRLLQRLVDKHV